MERYYAPGGLFEAQQGRVEKEEPRPLPPLEIYEWVNSGWVLGTVIHKDLENSQFSDISSLIFSIS